MGIDYSRLPYLLAIFLGLAVPVVSSKELFPLVVALVYLVAGSGFGLVWPGNSWRWGLWLAGPVVLLVGFSVLFSGQLGVFVQKDLPVLLAVLVASCLGSWTGAALRRLQQRNHPPAP